MPVQNFTLAQERFVSMKEKWDAVKLIEVKNSTDL